MKFLEIMKKKKNINQISDVQKIFEDITGERDINKAIHGLLKDYIKTKLFQLKVQNIQYETNYGLTYYEFEKKSANWENGSTYEIELEYYKWGEIITEIEYFKKLAKQWT